MRANFLKRNGNKTEILFIGSQRQTASISLDGITIDNAETSPSVAARNLGVIFDSQDVFSATSWSCVQVCALLSAHYWKDSLIPN